MKIMIRLLFIGAILISSCADTATLDTLPQKIYSEIRIAEDTLFSFHQVGEIENFSGFLNRNGDTIIKFDPFSSVLTDTFTTFAWIYDQNKYGDEIVGINRDFEVVFDAFIFDNGPDYISNDLMRIKRNGKIGYADKVGQIIIEPQYNCAYPFEKRKAKVAYDCKLKKFDSEHSYWDSANWFFIDKNGKKID